LANRDLVGRSDPYVVLHIAEQGEAADPKPSSLAYGRTATRENTTSPLWDCEFALTLGGFRRPELRLRVFDEDRPAIHDDFLGELTIPLQGDGEPLRDYQLQ